MNFIMAPELVDSADDNKQEDHVSKVKETKVTPNPAYHLGSSDNPGTPLVAALLKGENYRTWSRSMRTALRAKTKLGFIDDTVKKPRSNDEDYHLWEKADSMVMAWIINSTYPSLHGSISHASTAKDVWLDLEEHFAQVNAPHIHQLWRTLCLMQKQSDVTVTKYYTQFKCLVDELDGHQPLPECSCGASKRLVQREEDRRVHLFLGGFDNEQYAHVKATILNSEPFPSLRRVFNHIQREELRLMAEKEREVKVESWAAFYSSKGNKRRDGPKSKCEHCRKSGHVKAGCFEIIGYPANWETRRTQYRQLRQGEQSSAHMARVEEGIKKENAETSNLGRALYGMHKGYSNMAGPNLEEEDWIRPSFHLSNNKAEAPFNLIHCDVWGKYHTPSHSGIHYFLTIVDDYTREGILQETSCVATPQQNGHVERKHRHILNVARALRFEANLPIGFWGECIHTATHLINRIPTAANNGITPYEMLYGKAPNYNNLRVMGCLCYVKSPKKLDKFSPRSEKCVFVGYPQGQKGWKVFNLDTREFTISRDVIFHERIFPYASPNDETPTVQINQSLVDISPQEDDKEEIEEASVYDISNEAIHNLKDAGGEEIEEIEVETQAVHEEIEREDSSGEEMEVQIEEETQNVLEEMELPPRTRQPSTRLKDRYCHAASINPSCQTSKSITSSALAANEEPTSYHEAMKHPEWREAMAKELRALEENETWELTTSPKGRKAVGCKWVYKIKYQATGEIEKYKARLVAKGFTQVEGEDYGETFAPVAKMTTIRCLLTVAVAERMGTSSNGCKQCLPTWRTRPHKTDGSVFLTILVYVDDLVIAGNDSFACTKFKKYLSDCFHMKDLGVLKYFLGLELARGSSGMFICQQKYTLDILDECGILGCKPSAFPMEQNHRLALATGPPFSDPSRYRRLVGRLIYLTITRPEITYSVHILSQFMQEPLQAHWEAAMRVLRYLKSSPGQGIILPKENNLELVGFCDSDWAACPLTRRSISGYLMKLGEAPVSWKTKK
ncbi:hypothetical protein TSUD_147180 [Trifolium subterraneum]|uniref:Integrase catalytic domain-containing protein n=1 Tax=Trifolium subterraneum TaxID=3900 RepID=A0A2Z6M540_TRISU|nr:hypothetical protein TSUD_147180 [Trifolium subterraneum]